MAKIISANYRDRGSKYKWLVRDTNQSATEALECRQVQASGIRFRQSSGIEEGFGCAIVAEATGDVEVIGIEPSEETFPIPDGAIELAFNGWSGFYVKGSENDAETIAKLTSVTLTEDGEIFALI